MGKQYKIILNLYSDLINNRPYIKEYHLYIETHTNTISLDHNYWQSEFRTEFQELLANNHLSKTLCNEEENGTAREPKAFDIIPCVRDAMKKMKTQLFSMGILSKVQ